MDTKYKTISHEVYNHLGKKVFNIVSDLDGSQPDPDSVGALLKTAWILSVICILFEGNALILKKTEGEK